MLRDDAVAMINQQLQHTDTAPVVVALQRAQVLLETGGFDPWFLQTSDDTLVTVAGTRRVALPATFMREIEGDPLLYVDAAGNENELEKDESWSAIPCYTDPGPPKVYYLRGTDIVVLPTPDDAYKITLPYITKDAVLGANIENLWLKHGAFWLIGVAGIIRADALRDAASKTFFTEMAAGGKASVEKVTSDRMHVNRRYVFGGKD